MFYDLGAGGLMSAFDHVFPNWLNKVFFDIPYPLTPLQASPPVVGEVPPFQFYWADQT